MGRLCSQNLGQTIFYFSGSVIFRCGYRDFHPGQRLPGQRYSLRGVEAANDHLPEELAGALGEMLGLEAYLEKKKSSGN
jgi:hypothetical protein